MSKTNNWSNRGPKGPDDPNNTGNGGGGFTGGFTGGPTPPPHGQTQSTQCDELSDLLIDYNASAKANQFSRALFRDTEIIQILSALCTKEHPNTFLIGEAGVGKTQIIEELAIRLTTKGSLEEAMLPGYTIYELPIGNLIAGKSFVGQLEESLKNVIEFAQDPDNKVILFIDEIHQLMTKGETVEKIAQQLKPALGRGNMRVIGATTTQEAITLQSDPAFKRRWSDILIPELTPEQSEHIATLRTPDYQLHHGVIVPSDLYPSVVSIGDEFKQYGSHRPDTTLTLLDRAMSDTKIKHQSLIRQTTDPTILAQLNNQPIVLTMHQLKASALRLLTGTNRTNQTDTAQLKSKLDTNIIGQTDAKDKLVDMMARLNLRLIKSTKPKSFLFAGPTGTGKTEIAKQLAESMFGSKDAIIRLDLSEFTNDAAINRIIGSPPGYVGSDSKQPLPFDSLETNPFQIVLLDEFDKCSKAIQQLFMQVLDEGTLTTNKSKTIDFKRTIIIVTTNAGVQTLNQKHVGFANQGKTLSQTATTSDLTNALKKHFPIELMNRFDEIVMFSALTVEEYTQILALKYNNLINEINTNQRAVHLSPENIDITTATSFDKLNELAKESYNAQFNGRPAERTIQKYIEDLIIANSNSTQITAL